MIFIDDAFLFPSDRNRLLSRLDEDLASLAPGDRVAVVEYSGARLETRIGWSRSLPAVRAAIARVKQAPARGIERLVEVRRASAAWNSVGLVGYADSHQLAQTVKYSVLAATSAMRRLNPGTGKKILILVTGGWPAQPFFYLSGLSPRSLLGEPGEEPERPGDVLKRRSHSLHNEREKPTTFDSAAVLRALEAKAMGATLPLPVFYPPMGVESGESLFRPLTDTANLLHFTVYAASPMRDETALFDASVNSFGMAEGNLFASFDRELERQSSLFFVAGKTGGRALFRGASYGSLGTAASDYRTYYRLGFKLPAEERAVRHTVRVRVRRPGLRMRARHELVQAPERQGPRAALADALAVGAPLWDRGVALEVGKAQRRSRRVRRVALTISVPWDLVAVKPVAGSSSVVSDFRLLVKVDYGDGTATAAIEIPVHATLPAAPPAGAVFHYTAPIDVHPGPQRIGVAAYDPTVGEVGIAVAQIDLQ